MGDPANDRLPLRILNELQKKDAEKDLMKLYTVPWQTSRQSPPPDKP